MLPPFNASATCPKCGHGDISTGYVRSHRAWESPECSLTYPAKHTEHLDRHCQCCHYVWAEAVLDAASAIGEEG